MLAVLFDSATPGCSPTLASIGADDFISALATPFASGRVFALAVLLAVRKGLTPIMSRHKKAHAMTLLIEQVPVINSPLKIAYSGIREYFFTNSN